MLPAFRAEDIVRERDASRSGVMLRVFDTVSIATPQCVSRVVGPSAFSTASSQPMAVNIPRNAVMMASMRSMNSITRVSSTKNVTNVSHSYAMIYVIGLVAADIMSILDVWPIAMRECATTPS